MKKTKVVSIVILSKILELKKPIVLGTDTIEREIKDAGKPELMQLFYSVVNGIIKKSKNIDDLAKSYYYSCKKENLRLVTIDDCEIVAATAMSGSRILVTENRRTLNNPKVVKEVEKSNIEKKMRSVKLMDSKSALGEIFA